MSNFVMLDYIHETQEAALGILEKRAEICGGVRPRFCRREIWESAAHRQRNLVQFLCDGEILYGKNAEGAL